MLILPRSLDNFDPNRELDRADKVAHRSFRDFITGALQSLDDLSPNCSEAFRLHTEIRKQLDKIALVRTNLQNKGKLQAIFDDIIINARRLRLPDHITDDARYLTWRFHDEDISNDLLRGIQRKIIRGRPSKNYSLIPEYKFKKDASIAGDNGLVVGQWWPLQLCCVRDGAHGATEAGIYVGNDGVAVSVVLSGSATRDQGPDTLNKPTNKGYEDEDHLDVVWYCGNRGINGVMADRTKALVKAREKRACVRLIRSFKSKHKSVGDGIYAPAEGLRYDGLYRVMDQVWISKEDQTVKFKLVREQGQSPVRWKGQGIRPSTEERAAWERLKRERGLMED